MNIIEIIETLESIDHYLSGNQSYDFGWINHPVKPELAPSGLLREVIKELQGRVSPITKEFVEEGLRLERERESRRLAAQAGAVTQTFPPPPKVYKSLDPLRPKWGAVSEKAKVLPGCTRWFTRKADAEHFQKTGDDRKAIDPPTK